MGLNIKDPEAQTLARELADYTGESMTHEVIAALRERVQRVAKKPKKATTEQMLKMAKKIRESASGPFPSIDEYLYDERGWFK